MIIPALRNLKPKPAYNKLGISWHVHNMRSFSVFSTYLILTVFNRHASQLLISRLSFVSPNYLQYIRGKGKTQEETNLFRGNDHKNSTNVVKNTTEPKNVKTGREQPFRCKKHNKNLNKSIDFLYCLCQYESSRDD